MIGKDKPQAQPKAQPKDHPMAIRSWPVVRESQGVGISVKDGWNFGTGFGLAMTIAVPFILLLIVCVAGIVLTMMGLSWEWLL